MEVQVCVEQDASSWLLEERIDYAAPELEELLNMVEVPGLMPITEIARWTRGRDALYIPYSYSEPMIPSPSPNISDDEYLSYVLARVGEQRTRFEELPTEEQEAITRQYEPYVAGQEYLGDLIRSVGLQKAASFLDLFEQERYKRLFEQKKAELSPAEDFSAVDSSVQ